MIDTIATQVRIDILKGKISVLESIIENTESNSVSAILKKDTARSGIFKLKYKIAELEESIGQSK